jgi:two-component system sensor histidine kinase KdpD
MAGPRRTALPGPRRIARGAAIGAGALIGGTLVLVPARDHLALPSIVLLYLIPVLLTAATGGLRPALGAAVAADLLVNWFFIPPYRTLAVGTGENLVALIVYLLVAAAAGIAVDATTARAVEARELAAIDRLRAALLGAVGHDLRTPLAGIKAAVSSLRAPDVDFTPEDRAELLATVEESTDRLTAVVDNLLGLSRLQAGALSVDLRPVAVDAVAAQAALTTDPHTEVAVPDDLPLALADAGLLERVLANLLANARAAGPPGSPITVHGDATATSVRLTVVDHGPGLPPAAREAAFAPFQRLNDHTGGGLGLGLALARGFTEAQGGTLVPSDTPGGGLTMTITLPAAPR